GEMRSSSSNPLTDYRFTGQRFESMIGGLYDYGARFYDPLLGRFVSADTVVPGAGNPQALNRYAYVLNNPLKYTDPTGHANDPGGAITGESQNVSPQSPPPAQSPSSPSPPPPPPSDDEIIPPWQFWRFDAFGVRGNLSAALVLGGSINFDVFWNKNTNELSVYATPGGQAGALFGGDLTLGFIEIANLAANEDYREWAVGVGGTGAVDVVGVAAEWSYSTEAGSEGKRPQTWFVGYAMGGEFGVYGDAGYAVELARMAEQSGITILPDFRLNFFPDSTAYDPWPW
ncbi:MAG: RHS repeat-associated core domain-containing protein, partial [Chloroflexi bacterium]|nr:RHS repeat-associated core domain-containing protein [Chloroflexota bacterium]MBU1749297.1 RHS repeat-associated core domain-containing protein [Chloroflexota bacterium]